ncbi:MAG: cupin domain-containing protein [Ruminococcus sp.]|nr:cupin domain-containing protein [Ruminococcus sp.]
MNEKTGAVFRIAEDNQPIAGCTISKAVYDNGEDCIFYFSLAENTDISAEIYGYHKLLLLHEGSMEVYTDKDAWTLREGDCILAPTDTPVGMRTDTKAIYTEISIRRNTMNNAVKAGEIFKLAELLPYQDGKIINMDVAHNEKMKFVIMSFDEGTGLSEHAAPGEALIFALEGKGIIGYEGKEHPIKAGENFKFAEGGKHWVKADGRFKMALLMTLE